MGFRFHRTRCMCMSVCVWCFSLSFSLSLSLSLWLYVCVPFHRQVITEPQTKFSLPHRDKTTHKSTACESPWHGKHTPILENPPPHTLSWSKCHFYPPSPFFLTLYLISFFLPFCLYPSFYLLFVVSRVLIVLLLDAHLTSSCDWRYVSSLDDVSHLSTASNSPLWH